MPRTKGSKNKPKFQQLSFDVPVAIGEGTVEVVDVSDQVYQKQFIEDEVKTEMIKKMVDVHHMVRKVSAQTLSEVEYHLKQWLDKGYELFQVFYLGTEDAGTTYTIMYILVKRE